MLFHFDRINPWSVHVGAAFRNLQLPGR
jgi:hypothetical protein